MTPRLVLASASPRREQLLRAIGLEFDVIAADIDESVVGDESPRRYVQRLAASKARAVYDGLGERAASQRCVVLGSDTSVVVDDEILGKPCGPKEGAAMLRRLSGRAHEVMTGISGYDGTRLVADVVITAVHFRSLDDDEIASYVASGEGFDKAGGYGIQGIGSIFVRHLVGSYSGVVGLPLAETEALLRTLGIDTWADRAAP